VVTDLGSSDFAQRVLQQAEKQLEEKYRLQVNVIGLLALIAKVAHCYKIDPENLKSASKERAVSNPKNLLQPIITDQALTPYFFSLLQNFTKFYK